MTGEGLYSREGPFPLIAGGGINASVNRGLKP